MFMHATPMRHTQLFAYLFLPATREWPHSKSKLTLGQAEMFYHCVFSGTSTLITLTRQVTKLASMWVTVDSLPTMVPKSGSQVHQVHNPARLTPIGMWQTPLVLPSWGSLHVRDWKLLKWMCCQGHPRHFPPAWSHSSTSNTQEDSFNQVYRGPHQKVPR